MPGRWQGNVIVVGGAGGIGSALVTRYLQNGLRVAVIDKCRLEIPLDPGAPLHSITADVTRTEDIERARSDLAQLDWSPTHLVTMAGGALDPEFGTLLDTGVATIRQSIELNLTSHILLTRAFLPILEPAGAEDGTGPGDRSITLVSSINALRDYGLPSYSAAKAGMLGFMRAMASELGAQGIRINVVVPGTVLTTSSTSQPKDFEALRRGSALGRLAVPSDVAESVFALSHMLKAVTGQYLVVDCGQSVATPIWRQRASDTQEEEQRP